MRSDATHAALLAVPHPHATVLQAKEVARLEGWLTAHVLPALSATPPCTQALEVRRLLGLEVVPAGGLLWGAAPAWLAAKRVLGLLHSACLLKALCAGQHHLHLS